MSRPPIIAVLGVDGSGKTTQAKLLAAWLRDEGIAAAYFENPGGRPVTDWIARRVGRGDTRGLLGPRGRALVETSIRAAALGRARVWAHATGRVAVMDRYSYCQYALLRARAEGGERFARVLLRGFRAPDLVVFLTVAEDVAARRVELRGYDREEAAYLAAFAAAYRELPEAEAFLAVDGLGGIDEVQARLRAVVGPVVGVTG